MGLHKNLTATDNHIPFGLGPYANASARTSATGFVSADVGKFALQSDDNSIWMLTAVTPTWSQVNSTGGGVSPSRTLTAGAGLTGGGDLSADRTFDVVANADGSITVNANDIQVGILASDAQHGNRGGGGIHANVVAAGAAGFMTGSDKTKLDGLQNSIVLFGSSNVSGTTTTRYLHPGYTDSVAPTSAIQFRVPSACHLSKLRVRHNTTNGNGNPIVYTLRVNGSTTALTVSVNSTTADGSDTTHSVSLAAGDLVDIEVTKAASVATSPSDILASMELSF